jgi:hypothetical protein
VSALGETASRPALILAGDRDELAEICGRHRRIELRTPEGFLVILGSPRNIE